MISIKTLSGAIYQQIYVNEEDKTYGSLLKYINQPGHPKHPKFREYISSHKYDPYEVVVNSFMKLLDENGGGIKLDDEINFDNAITFYIKYKYGYVYIHSNISYISQIYVDIDPIEDQSEDNCVKAIELNPFQLALVENQTIEMCKIAVIQNYNLLRYVNKENQTEEIFKLAVRKNSDALKYIPIEKRTDEIMEIVNRYYIVRL